jgi:hypothetical protein
MIINTKAAIKRIPAGTKMALINSLLGPCNLPRTVIRATSNALILGQDDKNDRESWLYLDRPMEVNATPNGFRLTQSGSVIAEYTFTNQGA